MKIEKNNGQYVINRDDGTKVSITCNEASLLINYCGKEGLRQQINDRLDAIIENDDCDLSRYEYGDREDFVQELFEKFEDEIDYGNSVSDEDIDSEIYDLIDYYNL